NDRVSIVLPIAVSRHVPADRTLESVLIPKRLQSKFTHEFGPAVRAIATRKSSLPCVVLTQKVIRVVLVLKGLRIDARRARVIYAIDPRFVRSPEDIVVHRKTRTAVGGPSINEAPSAEDRRQMNDDFLSFHDPSDLADVFDVAQLETLVTNLQGLF